MNGRFLQEDLVICLSDTDRLDDQEEHGQCVGGWKIARLDDQEEHGQCVGRWKIARLDDQVMVSV